MLMELIRKSKSLFTEHSLILHRWVIRYEGWYYMTYSTNDNVTLLRSQILTCVPPLHGSLHPAD